ncbi:MAG: theronine dehydrogenase [Candidatus Doudnabacteria bacterium CG10_big_fil_rev_8_21_14_0_10_42_18]|uniref:Theronine dehydrogenase n=1 Tax=Candidatus Doudnabacteria bacterium CG10_big_fil_rev_8_21_14_0_10_42_18 TaxID=1974552 RepID=A0A2H0VCI7_9BACT|nr:MAG: theronine dehydrogenase [Candidatus Doudnabacteria bacterium CG10_big_fil_rev_8_21_14_0_10_42_18]
MKALVFDRSKSDWDDSRGFDLVSIPEPEINEKENPSDANYVIIKVHYAGICGTDRGIWNRQAFKDAILNTIDEQVKNGGNPYRIIGHEFFGEIVKVGSKVKNVKPGDFVSQESHVICEKCYQCVRGQKEVCTNEKILGISHDGGFCEYAKIPAHILWKTDTNKIRPEIGAMQEPFGNAVHAASKTDVKGKTVAIFGLGPIGMFLTMIVKGMGASSIIGIEPNPVAIDMAKKLGIDYVVPLRNTKKTKYEKPYAHNHEVTHEIMKITKGIGVDVSFEMAGFNSSVNNAIAGVRRGGEVILFGLKTGDFVFEDFNKLVMKGITMHCVAGRRVWGTWKITKKLFEDHGNKIQENMWNVILDQGRGTILPIGEYTKDRFEQMMREHPKLLIQF